MYRFVHDMDLKAQAPFDNPPKAESLSLETQQEQPGYSPYQIRSFCLSCPADCILHSPSFCCAGSGPVTPSLLKGSTHTYIFISMIHQGEILSRSLCRYTMMVKEGTGTDDAVVSPSSPLVCSVITDVVACFCQGSYFSLFLLGVMSSLPK